MNQLISVKERMIHIYQKAGIIIVPVIKFFAALLTFVIINARMGYDSRFSSMGISLLLALFCAFVPASVTVFLAASLIMVHIYYISKILSVIVLLFFLVLYLLFVRMTPKQGYAVLAIPILFPVNMAYIIPLLLGMTAAPVSIVTAISGVIVYYLINVVREAAQISVSNSIEDILLLYRFVIDSLLENREMFLTMVIFSLVILVTYFLRRMKYDHAFGIAIASGTLVMALGFLFGNIRIPLEAGIVNMLTGCILSSLFMVIIQFFRLTLDYTSVERTQFEDDDYYYYVKAVPKIKLAAPVKNVVTIASNKDEDSDTEKTVAVRKKDEEEFELSAFDLEETVDSRKLADSVRNIQQKRRSSRGDDEFKSLKSFTDEIGDFSPIETRKRYTNYTGKYGKNLNRK